MKIIPYKFTELKFYDFSLVGHSIAGEETVIMAPEMDLAFDIGRCPIEALTVGNILLSHGHTDHSAGLPFYFVHRNMQIKKIGTALVPWELVDPLEEMMRIWEKIDNNVHPHKIIGMKNEEEYPLNKRLIVRAFTTNHNLPSLGFALMEMRHKLIEDFCGRPESELCILKAQGIPITKVEEIPLIAYLGDTMIDDFISLPYVANAKVLILECTFFAEDHLERSRKYKHTHVSDLPEVLTKMNNKHIVITHVTKRIKIPEAKTILENYLPHNVLERVSFLMG
jgi:ribonuclease Z